MKKVISIFLLILLVTGCSDVKLNIANKQSKDKEYKLSLVMVGDALIHQSVYNEAKVSNNEYDFSKMVSDVKPLIKGYDLAFYNQETIIGGKAMGLSDYPRFNSPEEIGYTFLDMGFNLVALANNHTLDRGEKAIINSTNYWKDKGVMVAGSYASESDREKIDIREKNGITYTLLSYTTITNGIPVPSGKDYLVNVYDKEKVKEDIERVRDKVDLLIVSMHWGVEYVHEPTSAQKEIANYLASLGVDIVIGHHPHVVQPITYIDDTLVVYSLGNFISAQTGLQKLVGLLASVNVTKTVKDGVSDIKVDNIETELLYTYHNNYKNFKVIPFSKLNNNILSNYESVQLTYNNIVTKYNDSIMVNKYED